jgi:uncharacterized protein (TIGR00369 family)
MNDRPDTSRLDLWNERMDAVIGAGLPMRFEELSKERVVMTMDVTPRTHQPMGILHGGASVVLAESAASTGANLHCPQGKSAVGQEINANHIRPKRSGTLRAVATPMHVGEPGVVNRHPRRGRQARVHLALHARRDRLAGGAGLAFYGHHSSFAAARRSSRWSGCAMAISSSARWRWFLPQSRATPNSVIT